MPNTRSQIQIAADRSLAPHPHRLELRGAPNDLAWPQICANCGGPASEQVTVRKVFSKSRRLRSSSNQLIDFRIVRAPVPLCATCVNEHRATVIRPTLGSISGTFFWYVIPVAGLIWVAQAIFPSAIGQSLSEPGGRVGWGLFALIIGGLVWTLGLWWRSSAPSRIESQTEITKACDFSRDVSQMFERERHIYAMRNDAFAAAFRSLNADRAWTEQDQARSRRLQPIYAIGLFVLLVGVAAIVGVFRR